MLKAIFIALFLMLTLAPQVFAGDDSVTPYGDYCKDCTLYGTCKEVITPRDAVSALER